MPDWLRFRDYARFLAVVTGIWEYAFLPPIPAARHGLNRMAGLRAGSLRRWSQDRVLVLANNETGPGDPAGRLLPRGLMSAIRGESPALPGGDHGRP